jgi:hypothetical protein
MSSEEGSKVCPNCGRETTYIEQYESYYCYKCENYVRNLERAIAEGTEEGEPTQAGKREDADLIAELESISSSEGQETEDFPSESDSIPSTEEQEVEETEKPLKSPHKKRKTKFSKYRYRTRILKGSILPILYGIISIQMLNKYIFEFPDYFEYEIMLILGGFLLGFGALTVVTVVNLVGAKKNPKKGRELKLRTGFIIYIPFLVILICIALFLGISKAWQFSMGFFLAAIFPILIVTLYEVSAKGKFFVKEMKDDPSKGRKLIFIK